VIVLMFFSASAVNAGKITDNVLVQVNNGLCRVTQYTNEISINTTFTCVYTDNDLQNDIQRWNVTLTHSCAYYFQILNECNLTIALYNTTVLFDDHITLKFKAEKAEETMDIVTPAILLGGTVIGSIAAKKFNIL